MEMYAIVNDVQDINEQCSETIRFHMGNKREEQRAKLRASLIDAAEARIVGGGLMNLKARDVTSDAGCALGALYNAFKDIDQLVLRVNSRTLAKLGTALRDACVDGDPPDYMLTALAQAYVDFALTHERLWSALFDFRLPEGVEIPDWHREEHVVLIAHIIRPLSDLRPDLEKGALELRARTLFAAVHGVVQVALQGRFVGVPRQALYEEVTALVATMARGSEPVV